MIGKLMAIGAPARRKLLKGALIVRDYVGVTLGPGGRNAIYLRAYRSPGVTADGVSVARKIKLDDEIEDLGAQTVIEASMKTLERVGDGTTTTAVLAGGIIEDVAKTIEEQEKTKDMGGQSADVIGMAHAILKGRDEVIKLLTSPKYSRAVKKGDIRNIVATSLGKLYPEFVDTVTDVIDKVGKDGFIDVTENWNTQYGVESEVLTGMRFRGTYGTTYLVSNSHREAVWDETMVLVTNHRIEDPETLKPLISLMSKANKTQLVIVCEGYSKKTTEGMAGLVAMARSGKVLKQPDGTSKKVLQILGVKAPSLTSDQFEDVAAYCDAKFIDKNVGAKIEDVVVSDLGYAKKVVVNEDDTVITEARGNPAARIKVLHEHLKVEKDSAFANQIKMRIGALQSGYAIIRVGASTDTEEGNIKDKIEDSVYAAKAALEEGIVQGGGLALVNIAKQLGEEHILYKALQAPHELIKKNAGGSIKVPATAIDPVKVTRMAVEHACSVAAQLISSEIAITDRPKSLWDELDRKISPRDDQDDFRDEDNQEKPFRT